MAAGAGGEAAIATTATKASAAVLAVIATLSKRRQLAMRERLLRAGTHVGDVDRALAHEAQREQVYKRLADERVKAGMKLALGAGDASTRAEATQKVIAREQRFAQMRASASAERVLASAELEELRRISPKGAFWLLGPRRTHTPDCLAMAGRFWPWSVLEEVHPLLHPGCGCYLISLGAAISRGLMAPGDIPTDAAARRLAAGVIAHVRQEKADAAKLYGLEEAATREVVIRAAIAEAGDVDRDLLACSPLRCDAELFPSESGGKAEEGLSLAASFLSEAEIQTGAMVALFPNKETAKELAVRGGTKPDELHVTLAFLGKAASVDRDQARAAVAAWAKDTPPLKGELAGIGHFDIGDGTKVTYRNVDLPALPPLRERLVRRLDAAGVPPSRDHGFTPHMTIDNRVRRSPVEKRPIHFDEVTLAWGEERYTFPLGGEQNETAARSGS